MQVYLNHKGPGSTWKQTTLDQLLKHTDMQPLVFTNQQAKDYVDALSLMTGTEVKTMLWDDVEIGSNMFFTYVQIPTLNQGAKE